MPKKEYGYIYFMTNKYDTTLYVGVTSDIQKKVFEHKNKILDGFTKNYNLTKLVYFENEKYKSIVDAIKREKQIKNFKREWKNNIINHSNPKWIDLYNLINNNDKNNSIEFEIVNKDNIIYEIPIIKQNYNNNAIAEQVRNDGKIKYYNNIKIQCPAKINLTLKITGKRDDGFHNLDSIMQTISLYDYLTISAEPSEKTEIILSGTSDEIPYNEKNLVYKAAKLFLDVTKINSQKISIFIEKDIPVAAGLAGGSTDGAGTLYGLNKIFDEPLSRKELHELCAKLGSDLNLCLEGGRQKTSGRGEILEPLPFEEFDVSLIKPINLGISAKEAYTKFGEKMKASNNTRSNYINDLEWAVIDNYKELQHIKQKYPKSVMSGSGSTYFGLGIEFENEDGFWVKNGLKSIPCGVKEI